MIKYYFFILLFLSFSLLSAQEKLTKEERIRREKNIKAGNPFVKYGCKAPVATLSKGKYLEVHDLDSIVIIGTTRWHVYKKIIVGEIKIDSLNLDAQPTGDVPGMWMSPDPLSEEYPSWNPYNYCMQNPINFIDPDGRDGIRVIDDKNKTITIKAVYYVQTEKSTYYTTGGKMKTLDGYSVKDIASMQKDYNKSLNDLGMSVSDGEYKGYTIKYDLQFKEGGTIEESEASASKEMQDGYSIGNSFSRGNENTYSRFKTKEIDNGDGTISTSTVGGTTADNKNILMNTREDTKMNRIHEIFHTFGFGHPKGTGGNNGIMKYPPEKPNQTDANNIGNGSFLPKVIVKQDGQN